MKGGVPLLLPAMLICVVPGPPSWALTYECLDEAGTPVFTDSPSQLTNCATAARPSPPSATPGGGSGSHLVPMPVLPAVLASPTGRSESEGIVIPLTRIGRSLVAQAKLNGSRDARLIVDTGAEITVLSHAAALDAGLLPSQTVATVTLNTAGGSVRAEVFRVGSVSVGSAEARNVPAAIHDLPDAPAGVDGLLGLTFLEHFLVTVDAQKGVLHLKPRQ